MYTAPHATGRRSDAVYAALKTRLLHGEFALGARLVEVALSNELGVSRTPIREALTRLWSQGHLERHPDGGFRPVAPNVSSIRSLYEVRVGLEHLALTRPFTLGIAHDRGLLEELREDWVAIGGEVADPDPDFVLLDESFHITLAEAGGNPAIVEMLRTINDRIRIVRMQDFLTSSRIEETVRQHIGIIDAVLSGDVTAAMNAFDTHLAQSLEVVEERSLQACLRMLDVNGSAQ